MPISASIHSQALRNCGPTKSKVSVQPDLLFEAHSSAMDIVFYEGEQFPAEYKGDAFVALKARGPPSRPVTRSCACRSRMANRKAITRTS